MSHLKKFIQKLSSRQFMFTILNILGLAIIIYILYATASFWSDWIHIIFKIIKPFLIGFAIAYVFEPFVSFLEKHHIKRMIGITIVIFSLITLIFTFLGTLLPLLYENANELANTFTYGIQEIEVMFLNSFNIDISGIASFLSTKLNEMLQSDLLLDTSLEMVTQALSFFGNLIIYVVLSVYFLSDYQKVRRGIKKIALLIHPNCPHYLKCIDEQLNEYIKAFITLMVIQGIMYGIMYGLLGHPNWFVLGLFAGISGIFPYIGPIIANMFGFITTLGLGGMKVLFLLIMIFILSNVDSYYITPKIYSKKIEIEPIWVIFGILTGSTLLGAIGVVLAMPVLVILKITYQTYKANRN